jgi:hypothetical protein
LKTLQNDGVQGWPSSTLHGECENGVGLIGCRGRALAAELIPTMVTTSKMAIRRSMDRTLESDPVNMMRAASGIKPGCVHIPASTSRLRLLLHVLDTGKSDALGAFFGVAEIELVPGHEHGIAVDVIRDAGIVG